MSQTKAQLLDGKVATIEFTGGSASTPSITFTGDVNTGLYSPGADQVAISTGGTGRLFVDASGNVGIKNAAPGNYNSVFSAVIGSTSSANNGLVVGTSNTGSAWIGFNDTGASEIPGYIKYNHSTDSLEFQVNSAERMRLDSSGRLGLGTSGPASQLDVRGDGLVRASNGTQVGWFGATNTGFGFWGSGTNPYPALAIGTSSNHPVTIGANNIGTLVIDTSGRVGIGVTGPESALDVSGDVKTSGSLLTKTTGQALAIVANPSLVNNTARIELYGTASAFPKEVVIRGDKTIFTLANASEVARIDSSGRLGLGTSNPSELLHVSGGRGRFASGANFLDVYHNGTAGVLETTGGANTPILFATTGTERMRITSGGELLVGGTNDNGAYNIQCNGTGVWGFGAYVNGSDERLKEDISPLSSTLELVKQLNPVSFRYKEEYTSDTGIQPGFIAQDLQLTLAGQPYVDGIVQAGPEFLSVAYQSLIPVLTKALQEAVAKIETLEAKVAALEAA